MKYFSSLLVLTLSLFAYPSVCEQNKLKIGYISYWGDNIAKYDSILEGSIAVINPSDGILVSQGQKFKPVQNIQAFKFIVQKLHSRNVKVLGYVPTGYFNHECSIIGKCQEWARIRKQVEVYYREIPTIDGIFFDEAAPSKWDCGAFPNEYESLRTIVNSNAKNAIIAYNAGVADNCVVSGLIKDEIGVLFEAGPKEYLNQKDNLIASSNAAHEKGAKVWHLVHSLSEPALLNKILNITLIYGADYFYSSPIGGDWQNGQNTWASE